MRWLALALILVLGIAQGYPLHGSNGAINCTIFGAFKDPWATGNINADRYVVLNVDVGLTRANASINGLSNNPQAVYSLTDGNDRVYRMSPDYIRDLQQGRWLIGFVVPRETIAKSLTIDPSADASSGEQFIIPFEELTNSSNNNITLLYYGVLRSLIDSNKKTIEFDIGVSNNGTSKLPLSAKNFSMVDQWGWKYRSKESDSNSRQGIPAIELEPNGSIRSGLIFSSLSPLTRPVELVYEYSKNTSLTMNIDSEAGLHSNATSQEECKECYRQNEEPAPNTLAGSIKATKSRLAKVKRNITTNSTPAGRDEL